MKQKNNKIKKDKKIYLKTACQYITVNISADELLTVYGNLHDYKKETQYINIYHFIIYQETIKQQTSRTEPSTNSPVPTEEKTTFDCTNYLSVITCMYYQT